MANNFQRVGSVSNSHVGREFEDAAQRSFRQQGISLQRDYRVQIGHTRKKDRKFDLGSGNPHILVECKSHKWTVGGNMPSAKVTVWNEAMYFFSLAPAGFRKVLFVLRDYSEKRRETLAEYYVRNYGHLIPVDVEVVEYDPANGEALTAYPRV